MYSFTGASRQRPTINLGGQSNPTNPSEIMRKAKEERQLREKLKHQQAAGLVIQRSWRSKKAEIQIKNNLRNQFDQLISFVFDVPSQQMTPSFLKLSPQDHLRLSRLILIFYNANRPDDQYRLASWVKQLVLEEQEENETAFVRYSRRDDQIGESWRNGMVPLMIKRILQTVADLPRSEHCPYFLSGLRSLISDIIKRQDYRALRIIGQAWYWKFLRKHILAFEFNDPSAAHTVPTVLQLSVSPFQILPPEQKNLLASFFAAQIFTIPLLPNRLGLQALIHFSALLPFAETVAGSERLINNLEIKDVIHLLVNLLVWGSKKLLHCDAPGFKSYMNSIQLCLDRSPAGLFRKADLYIRSRAVRFKPPLRTKRPLNTSDILPSNQASGSKHTPIVIGDLDIQMVAEPTSKTDNTNAILNSIHQKTLQWLTTLIQPVYIAQICSMSALYSSVSQNQLCRLMVTIICLWPAAREPILHTLIYTAHSMTTNTEPVNTPSPLNRHHSGGLIKELWRFSVRSGKISISLRDRKFGGSPQGVLTTLKDAGLIGQWEDLILLCELYSRCLMILGDEEFFDDEQKLSTPGPSVQKSKSNVISTTSRNPLTIDEVIELAGLLRNLAFGLYWTEGQADIKKGCVIGTRVSLEYLRTLATRLLQQIYIRDSRRPFCESGFWWMTSTFDLRSFIQTVVYEESHLEEVQEDQLQTPSHLMRLDPDMDLVDDPLPSSSDRGSRARVSQRQLAFISPRLGVLNNIPFVIPFEQRVAIFRTFIESDRRRLGLDTHQFGANRHKASIRRTHISEDGFTHLNLLGPRLKETIEIKFIDRYDLEEAGIDGGGVFKEFLTCLTKEIFDANQGLWLVNKNQEVYPNPHSYSKQVTSLEWFRFIGRVLGKALYEGILIDIDFADFFLNKWIGKQSYLDDLGSLDPELYQGLLFLKHYKGDVEADLSLNFTVTENEFDTSKTIELIPNGSKISVTNLNRISYIYLMSNYKLNVQLEEQCNAFFKGLNDLIELKWLRMFNQVELRILVGGLDGQDLDIDDMQRWTVYGGWNESHPTVRIFWKVLKEFDNVTKRKLLKFVTSTSRPPLLGFKELRPNFGIRSSGLDRTRLPSASTCVNLLKLPKYQSEEELKSKLLYALNSGAGFDLS